MVLMQFTKLGGTSNSASPYLFYL